jgi:heme a synthase
MRRQQTVNKSPQHRLSNLLFINALMVLVMIVLGGVTRLTGSGLSMVVWEPITGVLPPLSLEDWERVFQAYKLTPEFKSVNFDMSLLQFKGIFWLEYIHRLWGRLLGLTVFATFIYSLKHKNIRHFSKPILGIFILGGLQGVVGWYMVKSGLIKDPHVSPYRLMIHLALGTLSLFLLMTYAIQAHPLWSKGFDKINISTKALGGLTILSTLTFLWGALVAGFKAGLIYNTFPLMGDRLIPEDLLYLEPFWRNFIENPAAIQWTHRILAITTLIYTWVLIRNQLKKDTQSANLSALQILGSLSLLQVFLGILTLIHMVPVALGALHQLVGVIFVVTTALLFQKRLNSR